MKWIIIFIYKNYAYIQNKGYERIYSSFILSYPIPSHALNIILEPIEIEILVG